MYGFYEYGMWLVFSKKTGKLIGRAGLEHDELGYMIAPELWNQGYATEAARACRDYAFTVLDAGEVFSIIRDNNAASQAVARRSGMRPGARFIKRYYGLDMPHVVFSVTRSHRREIKEGR